MSHIDIRAVIDEDFGTIRAICDAETGAILYTAAEEVTA